MPGSDRDALEEIIRNESVMTPYSDIQAFADAIIRAGWRPQRGRVLDGPRELEDLPMGSVVKIGSKVFHKSTRSFFCWTGQGDSRMPSEVLMLGEDVAVLIHEGDKS